MKRLIVAFSIGAVVFTAVWASAASLNVGGNVIQSGGGTTGTCDADGVTTTYTLVWNATSGDFDVDKVTVNGINAACASPALVIDVDLANASGASLSHVTATVQAGGGNQLIDVPNTAAANVAKAQVAIHS
ncbi:MAG: hypothetical protein ACRDZ3_01105 [Acidimicrobiia bacterium]